MKPTIILPFLCRKIGNTEGAVRTVKESGLCDDDDYHAAVLCAFWGRVD
jgi:hypothetical protein